VLRLGFFGVQQVSAADPHELSRRVARRPSETGVTDRSERARLRQLDIMFVIGV
jgi:hypothetical protein